MKFTGERVVPTEMKHDTREMQAHLARYVWAMEWCQKKVVADLACGCGYGSQLLSYAAETVYAVDRNDDALVYGAEHHASPNIHWKIGDMGDIPLEDHSVDVVVSFETVEHLEDPLAYFDEVLRILRWGGVFIVSAPDNSGSEWHVRDYSADGLAELLSQRFDLSMARAYTQGPRTEIVEDDTPLWDHPTNIVVIP